MTDTETAARVAAYRETYLDVYWPPDADKAALIAASGACQDAALAALAGGAVAEAGVWTDLALLASFRHRKAI